MLPGGGSAVRQEMDEGWGTPDQIPTPSCDGGGDQAEIARVDPSPPQGLECAFHLPRHSQKLPQGYTLEIEKWC